MAGLPGLFVHVRAGTENFILDPRAQFSIAHDYRPGMSFPLATLETRRKLVLVSFGKNFWNGYWRQGRHIRHYLNSASQVTISGRENVLRIPYRRFKAGFSVCWLCSTVFVCHWQSSDWDWMKCTRCDRLLLEKPFYLCVVFVYNNSLQLLKTNCLSFWGSEWKRSIIRPKKVLKSRHFASRGFIFAVWAVVRKVASADNRSNPFRSLDEKIKKRVNWTVVAPQPTQRKCSLCSQGQPGQGIWAKKFTHAHYVFPPWKLWSKKGQH